MLTIGAFTLDEVEVAKRKAYLEITAADERRLRDAHPELQRQRQTIIDRFYEYLLAHEHTRRMLGTPGLLERLKELQSRYFSELTGGTYDLAYCENRVRVGLTHHRIGLSPEWYLGAYVKYLHIAGDVLSQSFARDYERFYQTIVSLTKIIYLDMGLALDSYHFIAQKTMAEKSVALAESNEELRRLHGAKQQLTDMIVHDLQNPLTGITAALQVLRERPGPQEREVLEEALRRCNDLSLMIMNVLQVSQAESGELKAYLENVELAPLVQSTAEEFRSAAVVDGRSIHVDAVPGLSAQTDATLLKRILQNLLRNALRHTPRGSPVTVRLEPAESGRSRISISDEGHGIPLEVQPHLFEPFGAARLRGTGLRVDTGLGLPSCRVMARALGAQISVESDGKRGTTFRVELPR